jgi:chemotaxis response regulator CheB
MTALIVRRAPVAQRQSRQGAHGTTIMPARRLLLQPVWAASLRVEGRFEATIGLHPCLPNMSKARAVIVIGASAGGVDALRFLAAALPADFQASVLAVLHIGSHESQLPLLLNHAGPLRAVQPRSGELIQPVHIYVAPPDYHLLVEPGHLRLAKGPRENWARPAIDPLFRSAARLMALTSSGHPDWRAE